MSTTIHVQNWYYGGPVTPELARLRVEFITNTLHSLARGLWPTVHAATLEQGNRVHVTIHSLADERTTKDALHTVTPELTSSGWGLAFYAGE